MSQYMLASLFFDKRILCSQGESSDAVLRAHNSAHAEIKPKLGIARGTRTSSKPSTSKCGACTLMGMRCTTFRLRVERNSP